MGYDEVVVHCTLRVCLKKLIHNQKLRWFLLSIEYYAAMWEWSCGGCQLWLLAGAPVFSLMRSNPQVYCKARKK